MIRSLPDFPAVNQRWNRPADGRVSPPVVVVLGEVIEELAQVIQPSDVGRRAELTHIWAKSASALDPPTAMAEGL